MFFTDSDDMIFYPSEFYCIHNMINRIGNFKTMIPCSFRDYAGGVLWLYMRGTKSISWVVACPHVNLIHFTALGQRIYQSIDLTWLAMWQEDSAFEGYDLKRVRTELGPHKRETLLKASQLVLSPGVPLTQADIAAAIQAVSMIVIVLLLNTYIQPPKDQEAQIRPRVFERVIWGLYFGQFY